MSKRAHVQLRVLPGGRFDSALESEFETNELEPDSEEVFIEDIPVEAIFSSAEALLLGWFTEKQPKAEDIPFWKETAYNDAFIVLKTLKKGGYLK